MCGVASDDQQHNQYEKRTTLDCDVLRQLPVYIEQHKYVSELP